MFDYPVAYVDIETTGGSYRTSRVLEVAVVRSENGRIREFTTLINPETYIPAQITAITGISSGDVTQAPTFEQVADELYDILDGAVFIAHNVRFDYSFLKQEFSRVGMTFSPKLLCTVRLSRALYAQHKGHSLAKLIERHEIPVLERHRAMADVQAIKYFAELAFDEQGIDRFNEAVSRQLRTQSLPPHVSAEQLEQISDVPGVYIFKDEHGRPLYVGKSITLRSRILSHFRDTSARELKISQQVHHVEIQRTSSELAALILESRLVKELQPLFNRQLRRVSQYALLMKEEQGGYASVSIHSGNIRADSDLSRLYGVYESRTKAKNGILQLTRTFHLCPKLMGMEKSAGACFSYQLGKCKGACIGEEAASLYNRRFELALEHHRIATWPFYHAVIVPINEAGESVIIDNWMIRGFLGPDGERLYETAEPSFSLDEYKIIRRFLRENRMAVVKYTEAVT